MIKLNLFKKINKIQNYKMFNNKEIRKIHYIDSETAKNIDELLMSEEVGYSIDQLMEIAGYSVALSINHAIKNNWNGIRKILTIAGPGSKIFFHR